MLHTENSMEERDLYGLIGKIKTIPGQRDELAKILLEGQQDLPGCYSYIVANDPTDHDALWITEVWQDQASHENSLHSLGSEQPLRGADRSSPDWANDMKQSRSGDMDWSRKRYIFMTLRFLHIPKTAGSTFQEILLRQYPGKGYFVFSGETRDDVARFISLPEHEREEVEIFLGHAPISTGLPAADTARIITFLRNPIERVKSFCQHVSEGKSPYLREEYPPESFSLDRFLNSGNEELANIHTKMLINSGNCALPTMLKDLSAAEARDMALANLRNRIFRYGLTEFFDESLVIFARALNWSLPVYVSANQKDTTRLIHFEDRHLKRIAELNAIDLAVYNAAKADFLDSIRGPGFDRVKLTLLRLVNPFYARQKKDRAQSEG